MRPQTLSEFVGQEHLVGKGKILRSMVEEKRLFSFILWGPPGVGKTTLGMILAQAVKAEFHQISAVTSGKKDLQQIITLAQKNKSHDIETILFVDEIHRWNKAQQDALLPHVESSLITLIGATTENPSFEVIAPLLSRLKVFVLESLSLNELNTLIDRALTDKKTGMGVYHKTISDEAREILIRLSGGDARVMLNTLEMAVLQYRDAIIQKESIQDIFQKKGSMYDKGGEEHYNTISAFIKSMRGSDVDAALYYLARMLEAGEDPTFIARRMIILASEDIGMADRGALIQANEAFEAVEKIGMPEAQLTLAHVVIYLASTKKSRAVPNALGRAMELVKQYPNEPIPLHLRNAPTKLMKELGYAKGYRWSEDYVGPVSPAVAGGPVKKQSFLPKRLVGKSIYRALESDTSGNKRQ